jgi:ABC-type Fe3+-hydroxamate transport system substrate-binding protein
VRIGFDGLRLAVVSPEAVLEEQPDYLLVIAWNFADEITAQQRTYRERGRSFILPIPEPRVVGTGQGPQLSSTRDPVSAER